VCCRQKYSKKSVWPSEYSVFAVEKNLTHPLLQILLSYGWRPSLCYPFYFVFRMTKYLIWVFFCRYKLSFEAFLFFIVFYFFVNNIRCGRYLSCCYCSLELVQTYLGRRLKYVSLFKLKCNEIK
jgi:hypothetical protein